MHGPVTTHEEQREKYEEPVRDAMHTVIASRDKTARGTKEEI